MKTITTLALFMIYSTCFADYIDNGDKQYYGKVISMNSSGITLIEDCTGASRTFSWTDATIVYFSADCHHPNWELSRSPVTTDLNCQNRKVFIFRSKQNADQYADSFSIKDGKLYVRYTNGGSKEVSAQRLETTIEYVVYRSTCISEIPR